MTKTGQILLPGRRRPRNQGVLSVLVISLLCSYSPSFAPVEARLGNRVPNAQDGVSSPIPINEGVNSISVAEQQWIREKLQADTDSSAMKDCKIAQRHGGYTGSGYVDFLRQDAWLEWLLDIQYAGQYNVFIRFSANVDRPATLIINNNDETSVVFEFQETGAWNIWNIESHSIYLEEGAHSLLLLADKSSGPLVDWLEIETHADQPIADNDANRRPSTEREHVVSESVTSESRRPDSRPAPDVDFGAEMLQETDSGSQEQQQVQSAFKKEQSEEPPQQDWNVEHVAVEALESGGALDPQTRISAGSYYLVFSNIGDLVLRDANDEPIWKAGARGGHKLHLQPDGNMIIRDKDRNVLWNSHTSGNSGATLYVDEGGQISLRLEDGTVIWYVGLPRGVYTTPYTGESLQYPIRAAFYYPWYPETWTVNGQYVHATPSLGLYKSGDMATVEAHIRALEYGRIKLSIASWWGVDEILDQSRISLLMDKTYEMGVDLKWSIYHEDEYEHSVNRGQLKQELNYLKETFAWHPTYGHVDGLPVIFVYNGKGDECDLIHRWMDASAGEWFVVLKFFPRFFECGRQPNAWHQYGPAHAKAHQEGYSFSVSPGFWRADHDEPTLVRLEEPEWRGNVTEMVESGEDWQFITTFNEHGEGTAVESCEGWETESGFGMYLDVLHDIY